METRNTPIRTMSRESLLDAVARWQGFHQYLDDSNHICRNSSGTVLAVSLHRRLRIAEFKTEDDARAWLCGRPTHDLFGNMIAGIEKESYER